MASRKPFALTLALLAMSLAACEQTENARVSLEPASAEVVQRTTFAFRATVNGTFDGAVTWSLAAGTGSIDAESGVYTAPDKVPPDDLNDIRVVARSVVDPGAFAEARITVVAPPITPAIGRTDGSTRVTITGNGFQEGTLVFFGSALGANVQVDSPLLLRATAPRRDLPGPVDVRIEVPGTPSVTWPQGFRYGAANVALGNRLHFSTCGTAVITDVDGDGADDIVSACGLDLSVMINAPDGGLLPRSLFPVDLLNPITRVHAGDVTGDGLADLVVGNSTALRVLQWNGSGLVEVGRVDESSSDSHVGRFDNAPGDDLLLITGSTAVIHSGGANGLVPGAPDTFGYTAFLIQFAQYSGLSVQDYNGDGLDDLVQQFHRIAGDMDFFDDAGLIVYAATGTGFQNGSTEAWLVEYLCSPEIDGCSQFPFPYDWPFTSYGVGDFDGNGRDDSFLAGRGVVVKTNAGLVYHDPLGVQDYSNVGSLTPIADVAALGDIDADGNDDLFYRNASDNGGEGAVYLIRGGPGGLGFGSATPFAGLSAVFPRGVLASPHPGLLIDGDDLLLTTTAGLAAIGTPHRPVLDAPHALAGAGSRVFAAAAGGTILALDASAFVTGTAALPVGASATRVLASDLDLDGDADAVVLDDGSANSGEGGVWRVLADGAGAFNGVSLWFSANGPVIDAVVADFDKDGTADVAVAVADTANGAHVVVAWGTGAADTLDSAFTGTGPSHLGATDLDGDGVSDLVVSDAHTGRVIAIRLQGMPTVLDEAAGRIGVAAIFAEDLDGGVLLVERRMVEGVEITFGVTLPSVAGGFGSALSTPICEGAPLAAERADVDGDGQSDLVVLVPGAISVLLSRANDASAATYVFPFEGGTGLATLVASDGRSRAFAAGSGGVYLFENRSH